MIRTLFLLIFFFTFTSLAFAQGEESSETENASFDLPAISTTPSDTTKVQKKKVGGIAYKMTGFLASSSDSTVFMRNSYTAKASLDSADLATVNKMLADSAWYQTPKNSAFCPFRPDFGLEVNMGKRKLKALFALEKCATMMLLGDDMPYALAQKWQPVLESLYKKHFSANATLGVTLQGEQPSTVESEASNSPEGEAENQP